jgi:hydroxylysine kinase
VQENTDILAAIAEDAPKFSDVEVISLVRQRYGLAVAVASLVSERDQNFHLQTTDGRQFVLKIANSAEDPATTDFQIKALLHIADYIDAYGVPITVPRVLKTLGGETQTMLEAAGCQHVVRVVGYLSGVPIANRIPSASLSRNQGVCLAHLGRALRNFSHRGSNQILLWDVQQALNLRHLRGYLPDDEVRCDVEKALNDFEEYVWPNLSSMRHQFIHADFNPDNVLTDATDSDAISGVIDFGDMLVAPLIADLAIGASYARPLQGDPLALITEMLGGYHSVTSLSPAEINILFELIKTRLCASISILYWRASFRDTDDPYLEKMLGTRPRAEEFLSRLTRIPRHDALQKFRATCAAEISSCRKD